MERASGSDTKVSARQIRCESGSPKERDREQRKRASGIEPPSHPWQGCIITTILRPRGAETQTCTVDTRFFRPVLYYLSYLGMGGEGVEPTTFWV